MLMILSPFQKVIFIQLMKGMPYVTCYKENFNFPLPPTTV